MDRASVGTPARDIFGGGECGAGRDDVGIVPYGGRQKKEDGLPRRYALAMTGFGECYACRRRGEGTPPYEEKCNLCEGVRIATPACALVRNDRV